MLWSVDHVRSSSVCQSVTVHIFDISIRMVSMMASVVTILKVFNCYMLPTHNLDGAETWWKTLGQHGNLELLKWFRSKMATMAAILAILKIFKLHLLPNGKSDWHNVAYHDQPNPVELFLAHLGL